MTATTITITITIVVTTVAGGTGAVGATNGGTDL